MNVLVTGSSGFIGSYLVQALADLSFVVMGVDIKQSSSESWVTTRSPGAHRRARRPDGFSFWECDILDRSRLLDGLREFSPHAVLHLASRTDLDEKSNIDAYATNIRGVENIVAAAGATSSVERCIYTSSQLVCRPGYTPKSDDDYCPHTLYGESKVLGEKIVRESEGGRATWCIVRPTTVWGPGMKSHYQRFFKMISDGRYFHVGRRPLRKSYGYVGNVVHQYIKLLQAPAERINTKTLYLADYTPISLREWTSLIGRELGGGPIRTIPEGLARVAAYCGDIINFLGYIDFPFNSFRLKNVLTEYQVDLSNTENICGDLPYTLQQGVRETVEWYKQVVNYKG